MSSLKKLMELNKVRSLEEKPDKERISELEHTIDGLMSFMGVSGRWNGNTFEVVKEEKPSGDYTNPILLTSDGIMVKKGLWYYVADKDLPREAVQDAFCTSDDFLDKAWFKF